MNELYTERYHDASYQLISTQVVTQGNAMNLKHNTTIRANSRLKVAKSFQSESYRNCNLRSRVWSEVAASLTIETSLHIGFTFNSWHRDILVTKMKANSHWPILEPRGSCAPEAYQSNSADQRKCQTLLPIFDHHSSGASESKMT